MAKKPTKKTPTEKYIDQAVEKAVKAGPVPISFTGCEMVGVKYDAETLAAVTEIAKAAKKNAAALETLASILSPAAAGNMTVVQIKPSC